MKYSFNADSIDLGIDDTEEFYSIRLTQASQGGGPAENYLSVQRSTDKPYDTDSAFINTEPYIEFNDPSNGRFADSFKSIRLTPTELILAILPKSGIVTHPGLDEATFEIDELTVGIVADERRLRKLRLALELVIADAIEFTTG